MNSQKCKFMILQTDLTIGSTNVIGIMNEVHYIETNLTWTFNQFHHMLWAISWFRAHVHNFPILIPWTL